MMKKILIASAMLPLGVHAAALAVPQAGDLALVSINADEDGFALVSFVDLAAGSTLFFTDNAWNGQAPGNGGDFASSEGVLEWAIDDTLAAGSVVRFSAVNSKENVGVSSGSIARSASFSLALSGDSITVYADQGGGAVQPLAAATWGSKVDDLDGLGVEAVSVSFDGNVRFAEYAGARAGAATLAGYGAMVLDAENWNVVSGSTSQASAVPDLTAFSAVAAVPEPGSYAMMLVGLGLVPLVARRRAL